MPDNVVHTPQLLNTRYIFSVLHLLNLFLDSDIFFFFLLDTFSDVQLLGPLPSPGLEILICCRVLTSGCAWVPFCTLAGEIPSFGVPYISGKVSLT